MKIEFNSELFRMLPSVIFFFFFKLSILSSEYDLPDTMDRDRE